MCVCHFSNFPILTMTQKKKIFEKQTTQFPTCVMCCDDMAICEFLGLHCLAKPEDVVDNDDDDVEDPYTEDEYHKFFDNALECKY